MASAASIANQYNRGKGYPLGGVSFYDQQQATEQTSADAAASQARAANRAANFNYYQSDTEAQRQFELFNLLGLDASGNPTGGGLFGQMGLVDPREQELQDNLLTNLNLQRGLVNQLGESELNLINRDFQAAQGSALGRLEARGLGSSSLSSDTISSIAESKKQSQLRLQDQLLSQKLAVEQQNTAAIAAARQAELERAQRSKELQAQTFANLAPNISSSASKSARRGFGGGGFGGWSSG